MGDAAKRHHGPMTVDQFLATDPAEFGDGWRYELVDGLPLAQSAPSNDHAAIVANISRVIGTALIAAQSPCRAEAGSGIAPKQTPKPNYLIPDAIVRCGTEPVILFEVLSPSNIGGPGPRAAFDRKRESYKLTDSVQEIVELRQDAFVCHIRRRFEERWIIEDLVGAGAILRLESVGIAVPLAEFYTMVLNAAMERDFGDDGVK